ncbi:MAG: Stp1/IreP family PP2C-type Ser/Thr phosphatase [Myxococcota bacterium]|nr:Stp1/IreP family PP2C-type Ser/Thr phosphatase [Myxococcota bacterium]
MNITFAARTDVGRIRSNNEDAFFVCEDTPCAIVCDGMGGHNAGEVASQIAIDIISKNLKSSRVKKLLEAYAESQAPDCLKNLQQILEKTVLDAGQEIFTQSTTNRAQAGMGTTCTAVLMAPHGKCLAAHVGDSRLYLIRNQKTHQLTTDHTFVSELVKRGLLAADEAESHPQGNVLSRALGVQPSVAVDITIFDVDQDDILMLCSDGLSGYIHEEKDLVEHFQQIPSPDGAIDALVTSALERGGHDNITAVALYLSTDEVAPSHDISASRRLSVLKQIPLFKHLSYNELVKLLGITQTQKHLAGTYLFQEGDIGKIMYVILNGKLEVLNGENSIASLGPGAHFGEMSLVDNAPRSASVRTKTDSRVLAIRRQEFFHVIRNEPVVGTKLLWSLVQVLSNRLRDTNSATKTAKNLLVSHQLSPNDFEIDFENIDKNCHPHE